MNNTNSQTEWTEEDTKIIEQYEQRVKEGNIKEFVIIARDNN
ncbi:MAG: hypothetical protein ABJB76_01090 [Candidatus Nitrosocosmicus sp.]